MLVSGQRRLTRLSCDQGSWLAERCSVYLVPNNTACLLRSRAWLSM